MQAPATSLTDPAGSNALIAAMGWVQATLLGTIATSIAVIAVASVGILMLSGRIDWRRGMTVIVGCFVLFGATSIAAGIRGVAGDGVEPPAIPAYVPPPPPVLPSPVPAAPYDPYAGASVRQ
jgi:type IV secretory pathway VirB2 component (pilin)